MKVISTNIAERKKVQWQGKDVITGIYKYPVDHALYLGDETVKNDAVIDRIHHGGIYKACYIFGANHYPRWQKDYTNLIWNHGMFGENLTLDNLDESNVFLGDIYTVGDAKVQVTEPRQPCFKVNIRFNDPRTLKRFVYDDCPGIYLRVLQKGNVKVGDEFELEERKQDQVSILDMYHLQMKRKTNDEMLDLIISFDFMSEHRRNRLLQQRNAK